MVVYELAYKVHYANPGSDLVREGAKPYPEGASAHREAALVAHPLDSTLWELDRMASEGLEHLAYDGHAHDLTDEAREKGWTVHVGGLRLGSGNSEPREDPVDRGVPLPQLRPVARAGS